jgi:hypothetical protein
MKFPTIPTWLTIAFLWIFPFGGVGLAAWSVLLLIHRVKLIIAGQT